MNEPVHYRFLRLPDDVPFADYILEEDRSFGPLSVVNILVGANNSGKSRLLRALFAAESLAHTASTYDAVRFHTFVASLNEKLKQILPTDSAAVNGITRKHFRDTTSLDSRFIEPDRPIFSVVRSKIEALAAPDGDEGPKASGDLGSGSPAGILVQLRKFRASARDAFKVLDVAYPVRFDRRYYIPILRGMRHFDKKRSEENLFKNRTTEDYFSNTSLPEKGDVFTGLELYQKLKVMLLGEPDERELIRSFEAYLSDKFFQQQKVTLIPKQGDTVVHVKIGAERQYAIFDLGDGMQSLIICLFNIFAQRERCLFFIEEPDMCMHPSMQRAFLESLVDHNQHQYFLTSHSNHLLDMTLDYSNVSVFHFSKVVEPRTTFNIRVASSRDKNVLLDLGVRNSSVFLTNATVWVEGITDRLFLRAYMRKYVDELAIRDSNQAAIIGILREDYHYSFVEYQGATLAHWSFDPGDEEANRIKADYVCAHAFLIADGDISTKGDRKKVFRNMLGDRFLVLPVKEIENLIPPEILKVVVQDQFERHEVSTDSISYKEYSKRTVKMGSYLDKLLSLPPGTSVFSSKTSNMKDKLGFCKDAVAAMSDLSPSDWSLTPALANICREIYEHIQRENRLQGLFAPTLE